MEKKSPILDEILFSSSDPATIRKIGKQVKEGFIRKIAPKIYSSNFEDQPQDIIRRNIFSIIGQLYPGALLSHRSALEFKSTEAGYLFITYKYTKKIKLPGITLRFMEGHKAIEGSQK